MNEKDLKRIVKDWANTVGKETALMRLLAVGMSSSMAIKLIDGSYESQLKQLTSRAILKAMKKRSA